MFFTAVLAYGGIRLLRPELYEGTGLLEGTLQDLERVFIDRNFGEACFRIGCPPLNDLILRGLPADVFLLLGTFVLGVGAGVMGGIWCAIRPRTWSARALEWVAMVLFCTPVYVVGFGLLLLFAPPFGIFEFQFLFELHQYVSPFEDPGTFLRAMMVPWLVAAAPLAAVCLRFTLASLIEVEHEEYMRTAIAKGLRRRTAIRRHAAPAAYVPVSAFLGVSMPGIVTNIILIESVFNVPGVFLHIRRAVVGPDPPGPNPDYVTLQAIAVYTAAFIVVATMLADLLLGVADPRIRSGVSGGAAAGASRSSSSR